MIRAACSAGIRSSFSSYIRARASSSGVTRPCCRECSSAAFEMSVRTPPGWTTVTRTGCPASSISLRSASVNPRTANLLAL